MMQPLEYIDLSLKIMNRTQSKSSVDEFPAIRRIDVAEISSRIGSNPATAENDLFENNNEMPKNMAPRFGNKKQPARVSITPNSYPSLFNLSLLILKISL